jgi:myo-inositol-1(or 4)-monophosphatase
MNKTQILNEALEIVRETGNYIRSEAALFNREAVEVKSLNQLVSYVDQSAERQLIDGLKTLVPGCGFFTEEATETRQRSEWTWIIDPLDGTTNYIHGLNVYSISVGLMHHHQMVMGFVYDITRDEMFYALREEGAYLNGKQIRVSQVHSLSEALLATGFPYYDFDRMPQYIEVLKTFMRETHGLRRMGSAAIDLAYTACGRFDGFFEYGLHPWDVAGGALLVEEAGGLVTDFKGGSDYIFGHSIIAAGPALFESFRQRLEVHGLL